MENSKISDWLMRARLGDANAREQLFGACRSFVAVMARIHLHRRLQGKVDPSDLVQQSMLEAHRGLVEFHGQTTEEWLAWLKQIVQHNAVDMDRHYRGANRRDLRKERSMSITNSYGSLVEWSPVDPGPSPSQVYSKAEKELKVAAAIEELPDDYRQVILLRNIERLPFELVAERMERTRGACQMLWMRAVEQLRSQLNDETSI